MVQPDSAPGPARQTGRGLVGVTIAGWLGNILTYLLVLAAARRLNVADYAELVTLFNLLLIGSIPSFALQAVGARRIAKGEADGLWQAGVAIGLGAALLLAVLAPVLMVFLHIGILGPLLVALAIPATSLQGLCQGVLQGEERFSGLAAVFFIGIVGKAIGGLVGLFLAGTAITTMAAMTVGVTAAAMISVLRLPELYRRGHDGVRALRPLIIECGHASHAYGVFLLLSVCDVLLARHALVTSAAATYAAGSVLTKGTLWLPQSVANVLFASLADEDRHRSVFLRAAGGIAAVGLAITAGCWLLSDLVTKIVAGDKYPELAHDVWLFALLGSCLAVLQFTLVAGLAVRSVGITALIWLTVLAEVIGVLLLGHHPDVRQVVGLVTVVNVVTAGLAVTARLFGRHRTAALVVPG